MPNHTSNRLVLEGSGDTLDIIRRTHFDKSGTLDLNTIVPMPKEIMETSDNTEGYRAERVLAGDVNWLSQIIPGIESCHTREEIFDFLNSHGHKSLVDLALRHQELDAKYGFHSWYPWSVHNWGTKWNCYDGRVADVEQSPMDFGSDRYYLEAFFYSAWSAPEAALIAFSEQYPNVVMTLDALDEGGGFAYTMVFRNGVVVSEEHHRWASLARDVFGFEIDNDEDDEEDSIHNVTASPSSYRHIHLS